MQVIAQANETILRMLKNFKKTAPQNRMLHFCVAEPVEEGVLVFNLLTRELVLLTQQEYANRLENDVLKDRWFVVPEGTNEKAYMDFVRAFLKRQQKPDGILTHYTIFTTTDCNARCFYCFELGGSRIPMTPETAEKVVQYIKTHCGGKEVSLAWFGGEPLYNSQVIDIICDGLHREGIPYKSSMVSNGYLFDDAMVKKAVEFWKLQKIQITLDGTEQIYNKIKAFIYRDTNPYRIVLANIRKLLDAAVKVNIRLNMDLSNAEDLVKLVEELAQQFGGRENVCVYAHHLFKSDVAMANTYSEEEWIAREHAMRKLEQAIQQGELVNRRGISGQVKMNQCMADNDKCITILPDGSIGRCEHHTDDEFVGHIDREGFDQDGVNRWKERAPEIPECAACFYYPDCFMLRKCSTQNVCFLQHRQSKQRHVQRQMRNEYEKWKKHETSEESEDEFFWK